MGSLAVLGSGGVDRVTDRAERLRQISRNIDRRIHRIDVLEAELDELNSEAVALEYELKTEARAQKAEAARDRGLYALQLIEDGATYREVGKALGVSRERATEIVRATRKDIEKKWTRTLRRRQEAVEDDPIWERVCRLPPKALEALREFGAGWECEPESEPSAVWIEPKPRMGIDEVREVLITLGYNPEAALRARDPGDGCPWCGVDLEAAAEDVSHKSECRVVRYRGRRYLELYQ